MTLVVVPKIHVAGEHLGAISSSLFFLAVSLAVLAGLLVVAGVLVNRTRRRFSGRARDRHLI